MSDLKVDGIIASTGTNTALTLQGKGSGKVDIGDGALSFPDADGDANQVIKTDGSGALAFVTPATVGLVPVAQVTSTAVASADFDSVFTSTYENYFFTGWVNPATADQDLYARISIDGGSNWIATSTYQYAAHGMTGNGTRIGYATTTAHLMSFLAIGAGNGIGALSKVTCAFTLYVEQPLSAVYSTCISSHSNYMTESTPQGIHLGSTRWDTITAVDSFQFIMSSGDMDCNIRAYGIANS